MTAFFFKWEFSVFIAKVDSDSKIILQSFQKKLGLIIWLLH